MGNSKRINEEKIKDWLKETEAERKKIDDLIKSGHSHHCACRIIWGDGICTCRLGIDMEKEKEDKLEMKLVPWEEIRDKLLEPEPWYKWLYYFFRYRLWHHLRERRRAFLGFFERGWRGYARHDLWSFDMYLAKVIGEGVKQLADGSYGWNDRDFKTFEEYQQMLYKMSKGFLEYYDAEYEMKTDKDYEAGLQESLELFRKYFHDLWD